MPRKISARKKAIAPLGLNSWSKDSSSWVSCIGSDPFIFDVLRIKNILTLQWIT
jgi:hypothetical protein